MPPARTAEHRSTVVSPQNVSPNYNAPDCPGQCLAKRSASRRRIARPFFGAMVSCRMSKIGRSMVGEVLSAPRIASTGISRLQLGVGAYSVLIETLVIRDVSSGVDSVFLARKARAWRRRCRLIWGAGGSSYCRWCVLRGVGGPHWGERIECDPLGHAGAGGGFGDTEAAGRGYSDGTD